MGHSDLLVITNNLHVANELYRHKSIEVFMTRGTIRQSDGGIVGAVTVSQIEQFRVDIAVIGTSAIDLNGTLLDFDIREVEISRAIIEHARRVFLVSDSSKFSRSALVRSRICPKSTFSSPIASPRPQSLRFARNAR